MSGRGVRVPPPLKEAVWYVQVTEEPIPVWELTAEELAEIYESQGWKPGDGLDSLPPGPELLERPPYGPYTERQAEALVELLEQPEVKARERIYAARALPMARYVPGGRRPRGGRHE